MEGGFATRPRVIPTDRPEIKERTKDTLDPHPSTDAPDDPDDRPEIKERTKDTLDSHPSSDAPDDPDDIEEKTEERPVSHPATDVPTASQTNIAQNYHF